MDIFDQHLDRPLYKAGHILLATFFGGPLAATYLIVQNFRQLDQPEKAKMATWMGIGSFLLFIRIALWLPRTEHLPSYGLSILILVLTHYVVKYYQGTAIDDHTAAGGPVYGAGRALVIGLIGFAVSLLVLVILLLIFYPGVA